MRSWPFIPLPLVTAHLSCTQARALRARTSMSTAAPTTRACCASQAAAEENGSGVDRRAGALLHVLWWWIGHMCAALRAPAGHWRLQRAPWTGVLQWLRGSISYVGFGRRRRAAGAADGRLARRGACGPSWACCWPRRRRRGPRGGPRRGPFGAVPQTRMLVSSPGGRQVGVNDGRGCARRRSTQNGVRY